MNSLIMPKRMIMLGVLVVCLLGLFSSTAYATGVFWAPNTTTKVSSFQTDQFTGAAITAVPIATGGGRMAPGLAFAYNSIAIDQMTRFFDSPSGRCGDGWMLTGLSSVERDGWGEDYYLSIGG